MTELVNNVDYISAFRINTGGDNSNYLNQLEQTISNNQSQLQATQSQAGSPSSQSSSGSSSSSSTQRQVWNLTPQGANAQVQVELNRANNEILVSGNFSDILMLNRAITQTTGTTTGITVQA